MTCLLRRTWTSPFSLTAADGTLTTAREGAGPRRLRWVRARLRARRAPRADVEPQPDGSATLTVQQFQDRPGGPRCGALPRAAHRRGRESLVPDRPLRCPQGRRGHRCLVQPPARRARRSTCAPSGPALWPPPQTCMLRERSCLPPSSWHGRQVQERRSGALHPGHGIVSP